MADGTLKVSPELLQRGARALQEQHRTMSEALDDIGKRYKQLRGVWTGPTATGTTQQWESLRKTLTNHISQLEGHARILAETAEKHAAQEDTTKKNITATAEQLA
ncbi:WXG100 family type VII secretion target [Mycobacteroides abscessus]|uniref:WXG100 family type VII secretion target n=1 Tax=Mycobacteroides abscessus TaxID=36809 RepID=UPI000D3EC05D|nr:WXG100 family type VII secretion target [Mycobacteroides abscessus]PVB31634.1 WXG100 family type VII secretion target [Mycobacteroides abscessus]